jgi:CheY-like chemotaxis protein
MEGATTIAAPGRLEVAKSGPRILLVDDEPLITRALARYLRRYLVDADIRVAHDGEQALQLLPELRPHVMLTDLAMPRMGGLELAQRIMLDPELGRPRVLVFSGSLEPDIHAALGRAGIEGWLHKPARLQDVLAMVLAALPSDQGLVQTG